MSTLQCWTILRIFNCGKNCFNQRAEAHKSYFFYHPMKKWTLFKKNINTLYVDRMHDSFTNYNVCFLIRRFSTSQLRKHIDHHDSSLHIRQRNSLELTKGVWGQRITWIGLASNFLLGVGYMFAYTFTHKAHAMK
jgi:hypothetical protein